jgi:helix-turn-helix protein
MHTITKIFLRHWVLLEAKLRFKVKVCKETFFCGLKVKMFNNLYLMFDWLIIFSFGVESDDDRFWQSYEVLLKVKIILDEWEKSKLLMSFFIIVFNVKLHSFLKVQTLEFVKLLNKVIKLWILQKIDEKNVLIKILLRHLAKISSGLKCLNTKKIST